MEEKKKKTQRKNKKKKKYNTILVNGTRIALTCVIESNSRLKSPFLSFFLSLASPRRFASSVFFLSAEISWTRETNNTGRRVVKNARVRHVRPSRSFVFIYYIKVRQRHARGPRLSLFPGPRNGEKGGGAFARAI